MNQRECLERTEGIRRIVEKDMGEGQGDAMAAVAGTGWAEGLDLNFQEEGSIDYDRFGEFMLTGGELTGHAKGISWGTVEGKRVIKVRRVHTYEDTDLAVRLSTRMVLDAIRPHLHGLIITNGVGTLHGPLTDPRGPDIAAENMARIDAAAASKRNREKQEIRVRDVAVVDSFETRYLGPYTPLIGQEFLDFDHEGYKRGYGTIDQHYLQFARQIIGAVQNGHAPLARYGYLAGPQFEDRGTKLCLREEACDVVGMSGTEGIFATLRRLPFIHLALVTNGAFDPHSHKGNTEIGKEMAPTLAEILKLAVTTPWVVG